MTLLLSVFAVSRVARLLVNRGAARKRDTLWIVCLLRLRRPDSRAIGATPRAYDQAASLNTPEWSILHRCRHSSPRPGKVRNRIRRKKPPEGDFQRTLLRCGRGPQFPPLGRVSSTRPQQPDVVQPGRQPLAAYGATDHIVLIRHLPNYLLRYFARGVRVNVRRYEVEVDEPTGSRGVPASAGVLESAAAIRNRTASRNRFMEDIADPLLLNLVRG